MPSFCIMTARVAMNHHFDLGGLREHVERRDRFDSEFLLQFAKIARERGRIARNINQRSGCKIDNRLSCARAKAGGWRIDDQGRFSAGPGRS